jgi:hypothetical protein
MRLNAPTRIAHRRNRQLVCNPSKIVAAYIGEGVRVEDLEQPRGGTHVHLDITQSHQTDLDFTLQTNICLRTVVPDDMARIRNILQFIKPLHHHLQ